MTSIQRLPHTVSERINRDNKKLALLDERSTIGILLTPHPKVLVIMLVLIGYSNRSTYSQ